MNLESFWEEIVGFFTNIFETIASFFEDLFN